MKRFFIVDPMIVDCSGHAFQMAWLLKRELAGRDWQTHVLLSHKVADGRVLADLAPDCLLDHVSDTSFANPTISLGADNYRFYEQLRSGLPEDIGPDDALFFQVVMIRNLFGLMRWLDERPAGRMPTCAFLLWSQQCFDGFDGAVHHRNSGFFGEFLRWAATKGRARVHVFAFAQGHVAHLQSLYDGSLPLLELPLNGLVAGLDSPDTEVPEAPTLPSGRPVVAYLGNSCWAHKGLAQMLGATRSLLAHPTRPHFLIQVDTAAARDFDAAALRESYRDVLTHDAVSVVEGNVVPTIYKRLVEAADIIVLPYGPAYRWQPSGILYEAIWHEKVAVVPDPSSLADCLAAWGVVMPRFPTWTPAAVAAATAEALDRLPTYRAAAAAHAAVMRRQRPLSAFLDRLGCT